MNYGHVSTLKRAASGKTPSTMATLHYLEGPNAHPQDSQPFMISVPQPMLNGRRREGQWDVILGVSHDLYTKQSVLSKNSESRCCQPHPLSPFAIHSRAVLQSPYLFGPGSRQRITVQQRRRWRRNDAVHVTGRLG